LCNELRAALSLFRWYGDYPDSVQPQSYLSSSQKPNNGIHYEPDECILELYTPSLRHRHSATYPTVTLRTARCESTFMKFGSDYTHGHLCTNTQWRLAENQTTHRNLIGRRVTAPPPVQSPNSILPPTSSIALSFSQRQFRRAFDERPYCTLLLFKIIA